ncbi:MAG TPA: HAD family hydrolase [Pyrinomonadaceae bacterium]|jgi:putative hydrolase of the HAD superfamily|nr:HAD family hydrolase [Pyrinomonadaceae bacterium]
MNSQSIAYAGLHPSLEGARAVVFDVGGTLLHPDWSRLARVAAAAIGRQFTPDELRRTMKEVLRAVAVELESGKEPFMSERRPNWLFRRIYHTLGVEREKCELLSEPMLAAHTERHLWCDLDPEARPLVEELKSRGFLTAVISNTEDGRLEELLELTGLADLFDARFDSFVVGIHKPDTRIFRLALERLGVEAGEAVYVGDSYAHDALPALAAGMRAVLLDPLDLHTGSVCPRIHALGELGAGATPAGEAPYAAV